MSKYIKFLISFEIKNNAVMEDNKKLMNSENVVPLVQMSMKSRVYKHN